MIGVGIGPTFGGLVKLGPAPTLPAALANWRSGGTYGKTAWFVGDSLTSGPPPYGDITTKINSVAGGAGQIFDNVLLSNYGEIGVKLANIMNGTSVYNINVLTAKSAPDVVFLKCGTNDVRDGSTSQGTLQTLITNFVNAIHTAFPNACIVLWMPNIFLSTDPTSSNYVTPLGSAQAYSNILTGAYTALVGTWPTYVTHISSIPTYGSVCQPTASNMMDILHPNDTGYYADIAVMLPFMQPTGYPFTTQYLNDPFISFNKLTLNGTSMTPEVGGGTHTLTQTNGTVTASGGWINMTAGAALKILNNLTDFQAGIWDGGANKSAKLTIDIQMIPDPAHSQPNGVVYLTNNTNIKIDNNSDTTNTVDVSSFGSTILSSDQIVKGSANQWSFCYGQGIASTYKNGARTSKAFLNVDFNTGAGATAFWIGQENTGWTAVVFYGQLRMRWTNENRYNHAPTIATYASGWPTS